MRYLLGTEYKGTVAFWFELFRVKNTFAFIDIFSEQ
jgi:hypothetical protein